ncbi:DAO-domain-containing protein [Xylariaceae sp. FL1019]|nr:DAO-domain-containing protein [Xylariaceae sp. FL1019]
MSSNICPIPSLPGGAAAPPFPDTDFSTDNTAGKTTAAEDAKTAHEEDFKAPKSILIIGSGVFGLSTALSLTRRPQFPTDTEITIIDRSPEDGVFPARDASSIDSSRIIRADYADFAYAALASEAQTHWRKDHLSDPSSLGGSGRYTESGLLLGAEYGYDGATTRPDGHPTGLGYAKRSWVNALALAHTQGRSMETIRLAPMPFAVGKMSKTDGEWADWAYLNTGAGWADAEASMQWLYNRVLETKRVKFINGTVTQFETTPESDKPQRISGVKLSDDRIFAADLVILATGAWTPTLLDLEGRAIATGQCLAYLELTEDEQEKLKDMPVCLNLTDGCFVIPPRNRILKIARHSYGYINPSAPSTTPLESSSDSPSKKINIPQTPISQPLTHLTHPKLQIPQEGTTDLRRALQRFIPWSDLQTRPFTHTKLCWYTDTPTGDWIVDYHPTYSNLFICTGGSGHAFKFLPILGEKVVDCLVGHPPEAFVEKWKWKGGRKGEGQESDKTLEQILSTEDGSRGGKPGLILREELAKSGQ